ncbi:MAG: hypothetical protein ACRD20_18195 [Terriglobales bacterium]
MKFYKHFRGDSGMGSSGMGTPFFVDEKGAEVEEATALTNLAGTETFYEHQKRMQQERIERERDERRLRKRGIRP